MAEDRKDDKDNSEQAEALDVEFTKVDGAQAEASEGSESGNADSDAANAESVDTERAKTEQPVVAGQDGSFLAAPPQKPSKALALLALLVALIAVGLAGFVGWQWHSNQDIVRQQQQLVTEHQKQLSQLRASLKQLNDAHDQQLAKRDQQVSRLQRNLSEAGQKIDAYARRLQTLTATTTDDWRLAEVEYLLGLANQRILTSKDANTAVDLLEAADTILLELADPRLFDVRKTVAADRAALRAVGEQDIDGAFLRLAALSQQVSSLQVLVMPEFVAEEPQEASSPEAGSQRPAWLQKLSSLGASTWQEIKSLVVVQRVADPIEPLLPPDQQFYLKSNLRLLLGKAQLALLDGRQSVYSSSLQTASQWVKSYFPQQFAPNQAMYDSLVELEALVVSQDYPDVSASLLAVRAYIAEQHQLSGGTPATNKKDTSGQKGANQ